MISLASVLIPGKQGHHELGVNGWLPIEYENKIPAMLEQRPGVKTASAGEIVLDLEIFFGSLHTNGITSIGFEDLEEY